MAYHTRKTFNERFGQHPLSGGGPSGVLQFMRNRYAGPILSFETAVTALPGFMFGGPVGAAMSNIAWRTGWAAAAAPFEVGRGAVKAARFMERLGQTRSEFASPVIDTRQAYTMRQAALHAMHDSAYSLRGAIGNEARMMHS